MIAIDGRVHQGHDGTAGEIGHQTIDPDGPSCGCGNRGCLEAFARADRIADGVRRRRRPRRRSRGRGPATHGRSRAWRGSGATSGIGIANMIAVVTPDRVVIGGGVAAAGDLLLDPIRDELRAPRPHDLARRRRRSSPAELGTWAGAIGAAVHGAEAAGATAGRQRRRDRGA